MQQERISGKIISTGNDICRNEPLTRGFVQAGQTERKSAENHYCTASGLPELLTPHSDVTRFSEMLQGHEVSVFPLYNFKNEKLYRDNISKLLNSKNPNQRILAYLSIASSNDTSKEDILLERIKTEKNKGNLVWAGMALLYLKCNHTTELFDFLVKNENFGDAHMLPMYVQLDKDSLQQTAYNRIDNNDIKSKILAAQLLAVTPLNSKTDALLKLAAESWDMNIKGYAIYSVKELQMGNLPNSMDVNIFNIH